MHKSNTEINPFSSDFFVKSITSVYNGECQIKIGNPMITKWLLQVMPEHDSASVQKIAGDCSDREYYRFYVDNLSFIAMDSSKCSSVEQFLEVGRLLSKENVPVPEVKFVDLSLGYMVLNDLGSSHLLETLETNQPDIYYQQAIQIIHDMQQVPTNNLKPMDRGYIAERLEFLQDWYIAKFLKLKLSSAESKLLEKLTDFFYEVFHSVPQSFVHVDYHSKNLLLDSSDNLGVIDYQDAKLGPCVYDLVSLLQDEYIDWPRKQVLNWIACFQQDLPQVGLADLTRAFDLVGLHRHLKNLSVFSRMWLHLDNSNYLKFLPRTLNYCLATCRLYPELSDLEDFIAHKLITEDVICEP